MEKHRQLYREVGERIAVLRRQAGLSQADLGIVSGVSRTTIANIEAGRQSIPLHYLIQFAATLACDPADFIPKQFIVDNSSTAVPQENDASYLGRLRLLASVR